jgi:hypothetical protein
VGGAAAAAGAVAVAASGGGDDSGGSSGGSGGGGTTPTTQSPAQQLSGGWRGTAQFRGEDTECDFTANIEMTLSGSGSTITGPFRGVVTGVTGPDAFFCDVLVNVAFQEGTLSGTASNGSITFAVGGLDFTGSYAGSSMSGTFGGVTSGEFGGEPIAGTWAANR